MSEAKQSPEQDALMKSFREKVGNDDPRSDDEQLLRFLIAREYDLDKAYAMWVKWVAWRKEYNVDSITLADVKDEYDWGKAYWHGRDKLGHPCVLIQTRYHHPKYSQPKDLIRMSIYIVEEGIRLCTPGQGGSRLPTDPLPKTQTTTPSPSPTTDQASTSSSTTNSSSSDESKSVTSTDLTSTSSSTSTSNAVMDDRLIPKDGKFVAIYDRTGMTAKNRDGRLLGIALDLVGMLQDCYAERLHAVYIVNVNWFFWVIHKVVSPLLSKKTNEKVKILSSHEELHNFFEKDQLLPLHGGTSTFVFPHKKKRAHISATLGAKDGQGVGDVSDDDDDDDDEDDLPLHVGGNVKSINVPAGKVHVVEEKYDPSQSTIFTWHFKATSRSIGFAVYWIPQTTADPDTTESEKKNGNNTGSTNTADNSGSGADTPYADDDDPQSPSSPPPLSPTDDAPPGSITVLALKRYSNARAIKGSFSATGKGVCRFVFSNTHSWWFGKSVNYFVQSTPAPSLVASTTAAAAASSTTTNPTPSSTSSNQTNTTSGIVLHSDAHELTTMADATDD